MLVTSHCPPNKFPTCGANKCLKIQTFLTQVALIQSYTKKATNVSAVKAVSNHHMPYIVYKKQCTQMFQYNTGQPDYAEVGLCSLSCMPQYHSMKKNIWKYCPLFCSCLPPPLPPLHLRLFANNHPSSITTLATLVEFLPTSELLWKYIWECLKQFCIRSIYTVLVFIYITWSAFGALLLKN